MKTYVYLLISGTDWEGEGVQGVFASLAGAKRTAEKIAKSEGRYYEPWKRPNNWEWLSYTNSPSDHYHRISKREVRP